VELLIVHPSLNPAEISTALGLEVSVCSFFDGLLRTAFDGLIVGDRSPDAIEHAVVLAAVKDAARR
jgi:hypothetical protein